MHHGFVKVAAATPRIKVANPHFNAERALDVIAENLGGGGHIRASGYSVTGKSVDEIVQEVLAEIKKQL